MQFDQEFGNTFFGTGDTLINAETLMKLRAKAPFKVGEGGNLLVYEDVNKKTPIILCVLMWQEEEVRTIQLLF